MDSFPLQTSLAELTSTCEVPLAHPHPHTEECALPASDDTGPAACCQGIACAIATVTSWAASQAVDAPANSSSGVPHQHLLLLVTALASAAAPSDAPDIPCHANSSSDGASAALTSSFKPLTDAAAQLCSTAYACAAGAAEATAVGQLQQGAAAAAAAAAATQQQQGAAAAGLSDARQQFKSLLFWSCHLTAALHKFACHAQPLSTAAPAAGSRRGRAAAAGAAAGPSHTAHALSPRQQQLWMQHTLPLALQSIIACYWQLLGSSNDSSDPAAGSSSSLVSSTCQPQVGPLLLGLQGAGAGGLLLPSLKQQSAADQLLYGTCLTVLTTNSSSSSSNTKTTARKGGKPPAKQPRKGPTPGPGSTSNTSSSSVAPQCLELLASLLGCHLLFRHHKQLSQQLSRSPGGSSGSGGWCWCEEAASILADPQQSHLHPLLPQALASLLHRPSTRAAACNMLCAAAEAVCAPSAAACGAAAGKAGRHQQAPAAAAVTAAVNSPSSGLLLQLLSDVLTTHWPPQWHCLPSVEAARPAAAEPAATPAAPAAAEDEVEQHPGQQGRNDTPRTLPAAAAAVACLEAGAARQLLAASLLPALQPVASSGTTAALRKLWLSIAAVAAVPAAVRQQRSRAPAAAAAGGQAHNTDTDAAAAAACKGQVAALLALSAAAQTDKDATVRCKALALLQQAVPSFLQAWRDWRQLSAQQQQQQLECSMLVGEGARQGEAQPCPSSCAASSPSALVGLQEDRAAQEADGAAAAAAAAPVAPAAAGLLTGAAAGLLHAAAAVATALVSQLLGSSKASRLKSLQLLMQLVQPLPAPRHRTSPSAAAAAAAVPGGAGDVLQLQQQLVCITFPAVCSILAAGQDSPLYCQSCKAAAGELLPAMAAVLQPQQALRLALGHSRHSNSSSSSLYAIDEPLTGQQQQQQQQDHEEAGAQHPEALLLASLATCSAAQLYGLLQQQLQPPLVPPTDSSDDAATVTAGAPAAAGGVSSAAEVAAACSAAASKGPSSAGNIGTTAAELPGANRPLLLQLRNLVGGMPDREAVRRHAFMQACQALTRAAAAADAGADAAPGAAEGGDAEGGDFAAAAAAAGNGAGEQTEAAGGSGGSPEQLQQALLQAMQLLQVCGGCCASSAHDLRAELAILTDALDLCCMWLQQGAAAVAGLATAAGTDTATAAVGGICGGLQEDTGGSNASGSSSSSGSMAVCYELLWSILSILDAALTAAAAAAEGSTGQLNTTTAAPAASGAGGGVWCSQWMWGEVGSCLMHHLDAVVAYSSADAAAVRLPASTLDLYIKVLCSASSSQQLLLHDLLCTWHKQLSSQPQPAAPAVPAAAGAATDAHATPPQQCPDPAAARAAAAAVAAAVADARLVAFLLLVKNLSGLYASEQARFRQRVVHAMKAAAAAAAGTAGADPGAADAQQEVGMRPAQLSPSNTLQRQQQQQQMFDYMLDEEEAACVEASVARFTADLLAQTAPACYLPLLLRLVGAEAAPCHVRVLALQALEPLLLVSADLSRRHSSSLEALLLLPASSAGHHDHQQHPPAALLLQAVSTAGRLITARPAESSELVQCLEQLLLAAARGELQVQAAPAAMAAVPAAVPAAMAAVPAAVAAAKWYCRLLLSEKLLLTGSSWGLLAAGLLADGPLQGVADTMLQLVGALIIQQRMPRCKVALELLLNHNPKTLKPQAAAAAAAAPAGTPAAGGGDAPSAATLLQSQQAAARRPGGTAAALVQQLLSHVLTAKELASESLTLPLLQAVTLAAGSGWGSSARSSGIMGGDGDADDGSGCGGGGRASQTAAAAAALLAACTPSGRCLEVLLRTCQAHKHSMALHCSSSTVSHLIAFVHNFTSTTGGSKPGQTGAKAGAGAAAEGSSKGAAASAQHASMQQQLLRLLTGIAGAATAHPALPNAHDAAAAAAEALTGAAGDGSDTQGNLTSAAAAAAGAALQARASAAAAAGPSEAPGEPALQAGRRTRRAGGQSSAATAAAAAVAAAAAQVDAAAAAAAAGGGMKRSRAAARLPADRRGGSAAAAADAAAALQALLQERQQDVLRLCSLGPSG